MFYIGDKVTLTRKRTKSAGIVYAVDVINEFRRTYYTVIWGNNLMKSYREYELEPFDLPVYKNVQDLL